MHRPNILALSFASSTKWAMVILIVLMFITGTLLYFFYRATSVCCRLGTVEGLQAANWFPHKWTLIFMSFVLTVVYLPLSTMAVHVVVWSDDLWVVPNPYTNATSLPPVLPPLGPSAEYRDPLDFCWTTTMRRNELNYAPALVILALISLGGVSGRLLPCYPGLTACSSQYGTPSTSTASSSSFTRASTRTPSSAPSGATATWTGSTSGCSTATRTRSSSSTTARLHLMPLPSPPL